MKAALDVHYRNDRAVAACVVFRTWMDGAPVEVFRVTVPDPLPYRAGRFYERELPCLLAVLDKACRGLEEKPRSGLDTIIIDGYVHLRADVGKGLGAHLRDSLAFPATIIGVAKRPSKVADRFVPVVRGRSRKPLYVSVSGCQVETAARAVAGMHGRYRIPTLLRIADREARR